MANATDQGNQWKKFPCKEWQEKELSTENIFRKYIYLNNDARKFAALLLSYSLCIDMSTIYQM